MADNYLDLDPHIQRHSRALLAGQASMTDTFIVCAASHHKRMKYTRPDGVPVWGDVPTWDDTTTPTGIDITDQVRAEYERRVAK